MENLQHDIGLYDTLYLGLEELRDEIRDRDRYPDAELTTLWTVANQSGSPQRLSIIVEEMGRRGMND